MAAKKNSPTEEEQNVMTTFQWCQLSCMQTSADLQETAVQLQNTTK